MTEQTETYRRHFAGRDESAGYESGEYGEGSYSRLLWQLEQEVLDDAVEDHRKTCPEINYLDFASGTGRIAAFVESRVETSTSIEISESMADVARGRLSKTNVLCKDITGTGAAVEAKYDLITAFRFFLNAEPSLRLSAIQALAARFRNDKSVFIFNNHGNLWSLKLLAWPLHRVRNIGKGWAPKGNYLRHAEVVRLLDRAGLRVVKRMGLGFLGGTFCNRLPYQTALRIEKALSGGFLAKFFGQDIIYVATTKSQPPAP